MNTGHKPTLYRTIPIAVMLIIVILAISFHKVPLSAQSTPLFAPAPGSPFSTGASLSNSLVTGDFNGDGNLDVVTSNASGRGISMMLGDGTGGLTLLTGTTSGPSNGYGITAADFNKDGKLDIAVVGGSTLHRRLYIYLGNGQGGLSLSSNHDVSVHDPLAVVAADYNKDGWVDLALGDDFSPASVPVFLNQGGGVFAEAPNSPFNHGTWYSIWGLTTGDMNHDGNPDIITADYTDIISVLLGDGSGGFTVGPGTPVTSGVMSPFAVTIADFTGDNIPDVAVADNNAAAVGVGVLAGDGLGGLSPVPGSPFATHVGGSFSVTSGDFDLDSRPDIATANTGGDSTSVFMNTGAGFVEATGSPFKTGAVQPRMVATGDFNNDGLLDLALVHFSDNRVAILLNQSIPPTPTATSTPTITQTSTATETATATLTETPTLTQTPALTETGTSTDLSTLGTPSITPSASVTIEASGTFQQATPVVIDGISQTPTVGPTGASTAISGNSTSNPIVTSVAWVESTPSPLASVTRLPETGETPWYAHSLRYLLVLILLIGIATTGWIAAKKHRTN